MASYQPFFCVFLVGETVFVPFPRLIVLTSWIYELMVGCKSWNTTIDYDDHETGNYVHQNCNDKDWQIDWSSELGKTIK